jgi:hypothetical protein
MNTRVFAIEAGAAAPDVSAGKNLDARDDATCHWQRGLEVRSAGGKKLTANYRVTRSDED